ncbi:phosphate regulon sensor histidine kinase PhoR [Gallibacterium melopsittaci]|uniref:Phosphate regulon sensor protein PhoR n=1 Tax=Gallibacterium melopsittaci TaxID=516063 RepID=A0ABV6HTD9_9PAST
MKLNISLKHLILETLLVVFTAFIFSLFSENFYFWLIIFLILLLIWHHYNEFRLLELLNPNKPSKQLKKLTAIEHISQTAAYYNQRSRKEKIKTLRLLSKLNKNIQYLPDAIIICEHNGDISWCNQVAQEMFEFVWDKKSDKNIFKVIFYPEFKHYFSQPRLSKRNRPLVLLTHNKRYIEFNLNSYDSESYLIVARDVTSFIRLMHSRQTFLANMNHELRTPLTVLQGYLEMLDCDLDNPLLQQKAIEAMKEQSQRMANLLQQLSLLAKIENINNAEHEVVDLSQLVLSFQKNTDIINHEQQHIIFDVTPNIKIMGDEHQLQSAVSNLIYNAIRHAGDQATIHINLHPCKQGVRFSVQDDGIGIETQHLVHLTERFYRVDESRSNKTGGSGLGLAIVKHALEQHHTVLEIQSEVGKGSEFAFVIKDDLLVTPQ